MIENFPVNDISADEIWERNTHERGQVWRFIEENRRFSLRNFFPSPLRSFRSSYAHPSTACRILRGAAADGTPSFLSLRAWNDHAMAK